MIHVIQKGPDAHQSQANREDPLIRKSLRNEGKRQIRTEQEMCVYEREAYHSSNLSKIEAGEPDDVADSEDGTQWVLIRVIQTT